MAQIDFNPSEKTVNKDVNFGNIHSCGLPDCSWKLA